MAKPPRCKLCGVEHWGAEHVFKASSVTKPVTKVTATRDETPHYVTVVTKLPLGRPKVYADHAERQRAYRQRKQAPIER